MTESRFLFEVRILWTFLVDVIAHPMTRTRLRVDVADRRVWIEVVTVNNNGLADLFWMCVGIIVVIGGGMTLKAIVTAILGG